jgi:alginate O-acetyltransferase complex protein AlgJ
MPSPDSLPAADRPHHQNQAMTITSTHTLRAALRQAAPTALRWRSPATAVLALAALGVALPLLAQDAPGLVGRNDWLYYRYELTSGQDQAGIAASMDLIQRISKVLQKNDVAVLVAMVPLKVRIHPENLPASVKLTDSLQGQYGRHLKGLRDSGVRVADLNSAFLKSPVRISPMPLFFRLDTHWSATGALLGAETIGEAINADPALKALLDATPEAPYKLIWATQEPLKKGDLITQLPKGSPTFEGEPVRYFEVEKLAAAQAASGASLTGNSGVGITLLGSSYTHEWTKFPGAVRHVLQRDVLSISVDASQGQWTGLHSYLRDDAFQSNRPKLLIWEMPERDMAAPPQYKWRDARYSMDNTEWLMQASALAQQQCEAAPVKVKLEAISLGAGQASPNVIEEKPGTASDFVELSFDQPLDRLHYVSARLMAGGSKTLTIEASGAGAASRKLSIPIAGDDAEHNFRTALLAKGKGFTKFRLYPGATSRFSLKDVQVCAQPADLLR